MIILTPSLYKSSAYEKLIQIAPQAGLFKLHAADSRLFR